MYAFYVAKAVSIYKCQDYIGFLLGGKIKQPSHMEYFLQIDFTACIHIWTQLGLIQGVSGGQVQKNGPKQFFFTQIKANGYLLC